MNTHLNFRKIRESRVAAGVAAALLLAGESLPLSAGTAAAGGSPPASKTESAGTASGSLSNAPAISWLTPGCAAPCFRRA